MDENCRITMYGCREVYFETEQTFATHYAAAVFFPIFFSLLYLVFAHPIRTKQRGEIIIEAPKPGEEYLLGGEIQERED